MKGSRRTTGSVPLLNTRSHGGNPRIRIGVGGGEQVGWVNHVLGPFSKQERQIMDETLDRVEEGLSQFCSRTGKNMNLFNR